VVSGSVASWDAVNVLYNEIKERLGPVDVLVNNGAIRRDALMAMQSPEAWREVIETNLIGTFHTSRMAIGHMLRQRWGRIINVVSPSGLIATAGQTAYSASKAGVIGLTRTLAAEVGRRGVTVNALSPGFMITNMTKDLPGEIGQNIRERAPIPRFGLTDEVARSMGFFLASDYMTGQVVSIDGGVSIM
jgi:3-oxoacyl-[acyl-carrier protein] reductase